MRKLKALGVASAAFAAFIVNMHGAFASSPAGTMVSYTSPGGEHLFVADRNGFVLEWLRTSNTANWTFSIVQQYDGENVLPVQFDRGGQITGYYSANDNNVHVFFIGQAGEETTDHHLVEAYRPDPSFGTSTWGTTDLSTAANLPQPAFQTTQYDQGPGIANATSLTGYFDGNNEHVFYVDTGATIREVYHNPSGWWSSTVATGASALNQRGFGSVWSGSTEHVMYTGTDAALHHAWFTNHWQTENVSQSAGLPTGAGPSGFLGVDFNSNAVIAWGGQPWGGPVRGAFLWGEPWVSLAFAADPAFDDNCPIVGISGWPYYIGHDGHVYNPDAGQDITAATGAVPAGTDSNGNLSPITGFLDSGGGTHLFYIGNDDQLHEFSGSDTSWAITNLPVLGNDGYLP